MKTFLVLVVVLSVIIGALLIVRQRSARKVAQARLAGASPAEPQWRPSQLEPDTQAGRI